LQKNKGDSKREKYLKSIKNMKKYFTIKIICWNYSINGGIMEFSIISRKIFLNFNQCFNIWDLHVVDPEVKEIIKGFITESERNINEMIVRCCQT
jgi:hypothetical protein